MRVRTILGATLGSIIVLIVGLGLLGTPVSKKFSKMSCPVGGPNYGEVSDTINSADFIVVGDAENFDDDFVGPNCSMRFTFVIKIERVLWTRYDNVPANIDVDFVYPIALPEYQGVKKRRGMFFLKAVADRPNTYVITNLSLLSLPAIRGPGPAAAPMTDPVTEVTAELDRVLNAQTEAGSERSANCARQQANRALDWIRRGIKGQSGPEVECLKIEHDS